jgi:hypothetical protein
MLRRLGWQVGIVEKWLKHPNMEFGRRIDLWGFADLIGCRFGQIALFQVCAGGGGAHAERRAKILGQLDTSGMTDKEKAEAERVARYARCWMASGGQIMIVSWAKRGARGEEKKWTPRVEHIIA